MNWNSGVLVVAFALVCTPAKSATVTVDCDSGGSIGKAIPALRNGDVLLISGTCKENVLIPPDVVGITLDGQQKATIQHPGGGEGTGPAAHGIYVRGRVITIRGF